MSEHGGEALRTWRSEQDGTVLLDGFHALKHALRFGADVRAVLTVDRAALLALAATLAPDLRDELDARAVEVTADQLRSVVPRVHPTGVAALAVRPEPAAGLDALTRRPREAPVVVLDHPKHLGNVGAVVRLAAGLGLPGVVTTGTLDPWHPAVVRAAAGLHWAVAVARADVATLPPGPLYVLDPDGADIRDVPVPPDAVVAFGSERHGISRELRERAEHLVSLPMRPGVSSYNLATSVAMAVGTTVLARP